MERNRYSRAGLWPPLALRTRTAPTNRVAHSHAMDAPPTSQGSQR